MDKKTLTIGLAIALLIAFFLPYYSGFAGKASGFDIVKGPGDWETYVLILIPLSAVLLLVGALNGNYPLSRNLLCWLPLLTVLFLLILNPLIQGVKFEYIFKAIGKGYGVGLWVTIVTSVVLAFYNPKD